MAITTYSELQTAVANWLNRSDLTTVIPDFIAMAEARLNRDKRVRQIRTYDFTAAEDAVMPSDFKALSSLYHDGASTYGPVHIVTPAELSARKAQYGDTGVPAYAAIIADSNPPTMRFAPEPSGTYTLRMVYERKIEALSDTNTMNDLLTEAPDIYLYAALSEAEGYLQEDERVALWETKLDAALRAYAINRDREEYGGQLVARPRKVIGGDV